MSNHKKYDQIECEWTNTWSYEDIIGITNVICVTTLFFHCQHCRGKPIFGSAWFFYPAESLPLDNTTMQDK